MARSFTGIAGDNLQSASVISTAQPIWHSAWIKPNGFLTNGTFVFTTGTSGSNSSSLSIGYDSSNSGKASGRTVGSGGATVQALTSTTITDLVWSNLIGNNISNTSRSVWLNGAGKGTGASNQGVGALNLTRLSGNSLASAGTYFKGLMAHVSGGTGTLADVEAQYIGAGGHPRSIQSCTYYCRLNQNNSPETADVGSISLTVNGATFSNADMPVVATFFTGTSVADQVFVQGSPITTVNLDRFEDVSSSYTISLYKIGSSGGTTTATALGTSSTVVPLTSATGFVPGDYLTAGASAKTLILAVSGLNVLVEDAITWSNGATVTHFGCSASPVGGLSIVGGVLTGTPTTPQALTANYVGRAINNTDSTLIADSNPFSITVNAGAGGGGGVVVSFPPAKRNKYIYYNKYYPR